MTYCIPTPIPTNLPVIEYSNYNSPHVILDKCLKFFGISKKMLRNPSREREVLKPRQLVTYVLCKHTDLTLNQIAKLVGNKEHSIVVHSRDTVAKALLINSYLKSQYDSLIKYLNL